jgi:hypothetical protein
MELGAQMRSLGVSSELPQGAEKPAGVPEHRRRARPGSPAALGRPPSDGRSSFASERESRWNKCEATALTLPRRPASQQ